MAILSIQSHVCYGYAGNSAAVFPLQRMGHTVWAINTVEFSNHTGYGTWRGTELGAEMTTALVQGLDEQGVLTDCEAVLSGYMGNAAVGRSIMDTVRLVRTKAPGALYCCDPVMGDIDRGLYVKPDIPDIFKNEIIVLADLLTPNQFELEVLTGMDTGDITAARKAIDLLHARGPRIVLVTSYREGKNTTGPRDHIDLLVSAGSETYRIHTPELPFDMAISGSGDLTTAVFLSRYLETGDIRSALELTTASIYGIMEATFNAHSRELCIIAAQNELNHPSRSFNAVRL
ncbi:pyridoxal kinase PdxY [Treponema sp. TIM-1]|uniref:pyridoxal kinase PdxY n=1 Tax=Treponema sp. TIM-1 TaxID=2898417 RepID=UPI003980A390